MTPPTVLLFDIDGTLQTSAGTGRTAFRRTLQHMVGDETLAEGIGFSGRLDWGIWREVLSVAGYSHDEVDAQIQDYFRHYVAELAALLAEDDHPKPTLLPGVARLLETLAAEDEFLLGVVTGNIESAAWLKLGYTGIAPYFWFGAFGSEAWERAALPTLALQRAARFANGYAFQGAEAVVIGDTVHDIACAKAVGARVVAVATGTNTMAELEAAGADVVLPTLEDTAQVVAALRGLG